MHAPGRAPADDVAGKKAITKAKPYQVDTDVKSRPTTRWGGWLRTGVPRARLRRLCKCCTHGLATQAPAQTLATHESLDRATRDLSTFTIELLPHFVRTIGAQIGLPDPLNLEDQRFIAPGVGAAQVRLALAGRMTSPCRWGDLQIRSTPRRSRCVSMKVLTTCASGRATA